ncbi:hypothetical protein B0T10DRAFT_533711 [Thelonectria olida]|uniref:Thioesterase domain-containing protein n=1 Tax=Thelonectria olida TaxID=1576542 RepID=A0A9P8VQW2_9HYPO|nr:hypothetical protein B0T10DRAFT_533711 [Thelonectria olida]
MAKKLNPTQFVKAVTRSFMAESGLEPRYFRIVSAAEGRVDFELDIANNHTGTIASMVDLGGSLAVASTGRFATGVSTDLNVTYLSPGGRVGDKLTGTAICDKIGKTLAYTTVTFTNAKGQLAARGSHTKYVNGTMGEAGPFVAPAGFTDDVE